MRWRSVLLCTLVVVLPLCVWAAAVTYTERSVDSNYSTATHAVGIDFDADGDRDIVTCSYGGSAVDWYRNNGSQSFTKVAISSSLGAPIKLEVVDLDEDGDLDVVLADFGASDLLFFRNNGSMSFTKVTIDASVTNITDILVADFTGDDELDIVAVGNSSASFSLFKNDGNENFTRLIINSDITYNFGAGDIDRDGDMDLVASHLSAADTYWFRNSGSGSFTRIMIDSSVSNPRGIHVADIDDDTDNDFIISAAGAGTVLWFRNSGTGSFTRFTLDSSIGGPFGLHAMDVDDDGDEDWMAVAQNDGDLLWYDNNGSETFTERTVDANFAYAYWVGTDDINRDGRTDVVSASYTDSDISWWENGTNPDQIYFNSYSPKDNQLGVSSTANLVLGFRESVRVGTGSLTIKKASDGSTVETITLSGALVSGHGTSEITINPSVTLDGATWYYVNWSRNSFKTSAGSGSVVLDATGRWNFRTADTSAPSVSSVSPQDNATGVSASTNLVLTFNEITRSGTGTLTIKKTSDDSTVETITISGSLLTGNASTQLTLNPSVTLASSTSYYIVWSGNAFRDLVGNFAAASTSTTYWNFTTADTTAPTISALSPTDDATDVSASANLIITFDEIIAGGTGSILIKKGSNDSTVETIAAASALVTGSGSTQITINPSGTLAEGTAYYITIGSNAFQDASGNDFAGISSSITWNFTTSSPVSTGGGSRNASETRRENMAEGGSGGGSNLQASVVAPQPETAPAYTSRGKIFDLSMRSIEDSSLTRTAQRAAEAIADRFHQGVDAFRVARNAVKETLKSAAPASDDSRRQDRAGRKVAEQVVHTASIAERHGYLVAQVKAEQVVYIDVPVSSWYAPYVAAVISEEIATGYVDDKGKPTGNFGAAAPVTFAEILAMAMRAEKADLTGVPPPRNTYAAGTWAAPYIAVAESRALPGIVPDLDVHSAATRADVVTLVLAILHLPIAEQSPTFSDVAADHPHAKAIATAQFYGIIKGDTDGDGQPLGTFRPDETINRAEVAKMIATLTEIVEGQ